MGDAGYIYIYIYIYHQPFFNHQPRSNECRAYTAFDVQVPACSSVVFLSLSQKAGFLVPQSSIRDEGWVLAKRLNLSY